MDKTSVSTYAVDEPLSGYIEPDRGERVEPILSRPNRLGNHLFDRRNELVLLSLRLCDEPHPSLRALQVEGVVRCVFEMVWIGIRSRRVVNRADAIVALRLVGV